MTRVGFGAQAAKEDLTMNTFSTIGQGTLTLTKCKIPRMACFNDCVRAEGMRVQKMSPTVKRYVCEYEQFPRRHPFAET